MATAPTIEPTAEQLAVYTGWADTRLGLAYDMIDAALTEHNNPEDDAHQHLKAARDAVENADVELERLSA